MLIGTAEILTVRALSGTKPVETLLNDGLYQLHVHSTSRRYKDFYFARYISVYFFSMNSINRLTTFCRVKSAV